MNIPPATAQICFGQVRHTRLRPVHHQFNYGVYFLRLPLRGEMQSKARFFSFNRFNLLSFYARDHGNGDGALLPWIETLLKAEGITDADGEIWLQAFPRVLGYVFNPVTFWFCHRQDGALRAVLSEVRNTFGEKHYYLLDTGAAMPYGQELLARKVFHVSPFFAIEGDYHFRFMRTLQASHDASMIDETSSERTVARIDYADAQGLLLQTSISGHSQLLSTQHVLQAFFLYPLMSFGVMIRIHWQALRLWLKHVPFFKKPSLPSEELTR
jgi:DUF1365 family protein